jgi:hypothetical protein
VGMDENNFDAFCWVCWNICGRCGSWLLDSTWSGLQVSMDIHGPCHTRTFQFQMGDFHGILW